MNGQPYNGMLKFAWGEEPQDYKVSVELIFQKGNEVQKNTLTFDVRMLVVGFQDEIPVIRIEKNNQILNHKNSETIIDEITLDTAEAINAIELNLNSKGRIKSILNHEEVINSWKRIRMSTSDKYPGETIEAFLDILEKSLETPDKLLMALKRDPFLTNFFSGIYGNYDIAQELQDTFISGSLLPGIDLNYLTKKTYIAIDEERIEITEIGKLQTDAIDAEELIQALNTRTEYNRSNYKEIRGTVELKSNVSTTTGQINTHQSTITIVVDDLKIENVLLVTRK